MKDQLLCEPKTEALIVLDEPIDGWLFVVPSDMLNQKEKSECSRWQQLREIGASKLESAAKVVRGR